MATGFDTRRVARPLADFGQGLPARAASRFSTFQRNLVASRAFLANRRRDRRFPLQPYDGYHIANAAALAVTAIALLVIFLDPHLVQWRGALPRPVDSFFRFLTQFGKADWILISTGVGVIVAHFANIETMRPRERAVRAIRLAAAAYVFFAVAVSGIVANLSKNIIGRARPKLFQENGSFAFDFWSWNADWASFPSGHATTGMALGVALALLFPRLRWVFLCLGLWIAASRPFVGVHYPSDMLAGGLLGAATAWLLARAFARWRLVFGFDEDGGLTRRTGASGRLRG